MRHTLPVFHDSYNTCLHTRCQAPYGTKNLCTHIDLIASLLLDTSLCFLLLFITLDPRRDRSNFDFPQWGREIRIKRERVIRVDVPPIWMLPKHLELCARKRL